MPKVRGRKKEKKALDMSVVEKERKENKAVVSANGAHVNTRALSKYDLTSKQLNFVIAYINSGGNGTKAALKVCDVKDEVSAGVVASNYLSKIKVREAVHELLMSQIATPDSVIAKANEIRTFAESYDTQNRANAELGKMLGMYSRHNDKDAGKTTVNLVNIMLPEDKRGTVIDAKVQEVSHD